MDLRNFVKKALEHEPDCELQPLIGILKEGLPVIDTARKNDKRPAYMEFFCPDEWVLNYRGKEKLSDSYIVIRIPRETLEGYLSESSKFKEATV